MDAKVLLLRTALHHRISEPTIEAGFATLQSLTPQPLNFQAFCDAVGACLREGLIREPVRLPEGALQCHWHLELTSAGVADARRLSHAAGKGGRPDHPEARGD